jgi:signal transduction protein with GAF and PtsI domain
MAAERIVNLEAWAMPSGDASDTQVLQARLKRKEAALSALREISQAIAAAWSLDSTLSLMTRKTTHIMGVDSCSIYLMDDKGETLVLRATTGLAPEAIGKASLRLGEGITGWAASTGQAVAVRDAAADPRFKLLPETKELRFVSLLAVPLRSREKTIGAINVQTKAPHDYTPDEVELLSIIADLAAGAIEKARLIDEIGGLKEALETRKLVERAKGILMARHHITEEEAFKRIHQQSRNTRRSMREIAEAIILTEKIYP